MKPTHPVFTERTECQDCYKCIRECPVKAIKVESGYASVVPDLCVCCGRCVEICPHGAKKVRDDVPRVKRLLASGRPVIVSLAPSFASQYPQAEPRQVVRALRELGFHAVSETALGAERVSAHVAEKLAGAGPAPLLSSACPVVVEYLRKYLPAPAALLSAVMSPMLAHAGMLRERFGPDAAVVFIGPCIGKKSEADGFPELVEAALTFEDLNHWLRERGIAMESLEPRDGDDFVPRRARQGSLYPVEGGMLAGIRANCGAADPRLMTFSGLRNLPAAVDGIETLRDPLFLELLACEGGCINGPKAAKSGGGLAARRRRVIGYAESAGPRQEVSAGPGVAMAFAPAPVKPPHFPDPQIREVLRAVGKSSPEDELNCGGCGYDSCREFARAYLVGRAERRMCVTYMRKLAQKKAHVLMRKMPAAVVVVDESLRILECNPNFLRFFVEDEELAAAAPGLEGVELSTVAPFYSLFQSVLDSGDEILDKDIRFRGSVFRASIFTIEKHAVVAATFMDVTEPAVRKEQIIQRARQVIQKNLETVQQIAYLIGENAADSEIALNSIVQSFSPDPVDGSSHGRR